MNPQTDTPESAEAMTVAGLTTLVADARNLLGVIDAHKTESMREEANQPLLATLKQDLEDQKKHWSECYAAGSAGSKMHWEEKLMTEGVIKGIEYAIERLEARLTAQQSDTALKLQRCEEALRKLIKQVHDFDQEGDKDDTRFEQIEQALEAALTYPTRNEGEKKV